MKRVSQGGHLDPDVLAEFRAGLITGRRGRAISAHLASCADCAALRGRLAQVSALLAAVPAPTMPDALARRLDSALAAESSERASVQSPSSHRAPSWPPAVRVRRLQPRMLAQAAAALAVLAGIGFGLTQLGGSSTYSSPASSVAGGAAAGSRAEAPSGAEAQSGAGGSLGPERAGVSAASGEVYVVHSDVNYQHSTLLQQLTAELAARPAVNSPAMKTATARPAATVASAQVRACALRLSAGAHIVLVQSARYQGTPVTVVVASSSKGEQAWVAGPACSGTDSNILASVMLPTGISTP